MLLFCFGCSCRTWRFNPEGSFQRRRSRRNDGSDSTFWSGPCKVRDPRGQTANVQRLASSFKPATQRISRIRLLLHWSVFLTAACCPTRGFYTPPSKKWQHFCTARQKISIYNTFSYFLKFLAHFIRCFHFLGNGNVMSSQFFDHF